MLNENRVRHMTHMAMDEKKNSRKYMSVVNLSKADYLSLNSLLAFLLGTITYAVLYFIIVAVLFNTVVSNISIMVFVLLLLIGVLGYLMYLYVFMTHWKKRASKRYNIGKRALNDRVQDWEALENLYVEEEENKSPTIAMKDLETLHQIPEMPKEAEPVKVEEPVIIIEPEEKKQEEEKPQEVESALERLMREQK